MAREMRHSGIEWIDEIPKEWNICRLKDVGTLYGGLTGKAGDDFNVEEDDISYMLYIPFTNIFNNDSINPNQLFKVKIEQGEKQNLVQKGDLLFLMSSEDYDGVGKPAIMEEQVDDLGLNSFCKGLRIYNNTNSKFLFYLLSSHLHRELVRQEAKGFIRINLRQDRLSCCPIFLPPLPEQQKIANYLDKVCGEVDEMIALQEQMIEELKAYKQSVITEAVTKGLNPDVPMKDSGIDWIGEIPEGWEIISLQSLSKSIRNGYVGPTRDLFKDEGIKYIQSLHLKDGVIDFDKHHYYVSEEWANQHPKIHEDDLLIVQTGDIGQVAIVPKEFDDCNCHALIIVVLNKKLCLPTYISYYLRSSVGKELLLRCKTGALLPHLNSGKIGVTPINLPSINEQQSIASYLDTKCAEIDALIAIKQAKIDELKDYKKSVIYEYVTGKKEVV